MVVRVFYLLCEYIKFAFVWLVAFGNKNMDETNAITFIFVFQLKSINFH